MSGEAYALHLRGVVSGAEWTHTVEVEHWATDAGPWEARDRACSAVTHYLSGALNSGEVVCVGLTVPEYASA